MSTSTQYAHVILPLALDGYTYAVPESLQVQVGSLVLVPLGRTRQYWGVVSRIERDAPKSISYKKILQVAYHSPLVTPSQLQLWRWIATYYGCSIGEVFCAAIPTLLQKNEFKPLQVTYVKKIGDASRIKRAQQLAIIERYQQLVDNSSLQKSADTCSKEALVPKSELIDGLSISAFNTLIKNEIFTYCQVESSRLPAFEQTQQWPVLTPAQQTAYQQIQDAFAKHNMVLLHGVTSSGKTEIYLNHIKEVLAQGKQVLYLVPEIALTAQLENRLAAVLGDKMVTYHSGLADNQRAEIYLNLLHNKQIQVVLGTRSSVFLPFTQLGLVIIDEEHEPSYKQYEPSPRYHAKNVALMMAQMAGIKTLLGSATPSIESYYWAQKQKYGYVSLVQRYNDVQLPQVQVVDRQDAFRKNRMKGMFTWLLYEKMQQTLANGEQIILFQNRRGFSSQVECPDCGYVPKCRHCDVSLTYHKSKNRLQCHYCGYSTPIPTQCPTCGGSSLKDKGFGTEKVIEALSQYFPGVSAERLDVDATHNGQVYQDIIERFATGRTQILVGTQMVAKGLDFDNVGLVGILNADNMMSFPDFRSAERAYQLMVQVSGRAGRRAKQGLVVLQTSQTEHYLMPAVLNQQYEEFYQKELQERYDFLYPPFVKMIAIQVRHVRADVAAKVANVLASTLRKQWQDAVLGPTDAAVSKQHNKYVKQLLIKIKASSQQVRENVFLEVERIKKEYSSVDIVVDVDPI